MINTSEEMVKWACIFCVDCSNETSYIIANSGEVGKFVELYHSNNDSFVIANQFFVPV